MYLNTLLLYIMSSFHEYYFNNLNTDVLQSTKWVPYLKLYDLYTSKFKFKKPNILEIGARHGGFLLCYKSVFQDRCEYFWC